MIASVNMFKYMILLVFTMIDADKILQILNVQERYELNSDTSKECLDGECLILAIHFTQGNSENWIGCCFDVSTEVFAYIKCESGKTISAGTKFGNAKFKVVCLEGDTCSGKVVDCEMVGTVGETGYCPKATTVKTTIETTTGTTTGTAAGTTSAEDGTTTVSTTGTIEDATTTTITTTTTSDRIDCDQGPCAITECYFNKHCYSYVRLLVNIVENVSQGIPLSICPGRFLAVESEEEEKFIKSIVGMMIESHDFDGYDEYPEYYEYEDYEVYSKKIITSGLVDNVTGTILWEHWGHYVNPELLQLEDILDMRYRSLIVLLVLKEADNLSMTWGLVPPFLKSNFGAICERIPEAETSCAYFDGSSLVNDAHPCYQNRDLGNRQVFKRNNTKHEKVLSCGSAMPRCCGIDKLGGYWEACAGQTVCKNCNTACLEFWSCGLEGYFETELPQSVSYDCDGMCADKDEFRYTYRACPGTEAYGKCPPGTTGTSVWYCNNHGEFEGTAPDYSKCCDNQCQALDHFRWSWLSCPGQVEKKLSPCPDRQDNVQTYAEVEWSCTSTGFDNKTPDYSKCSCAGFCSGTDQFGVSWTVCYGKIERNLCPRGLTGNMYWECSETGVFIQDSPDTSQCTPHWIDDVRDKIENGTDSLIIIEMIRNNTELDSRTGLESITDVIYDCVDLFHQQSKGSNNYELYLNFTKTYAHVLSNVLTDVNVWRPIVNDLSKKKYSTKVIEATENVTFTLHSIFNKASNISFNQTYDFIMDKGLAWSIQYTQENDSLGYYFDEERVNCSITWDNDLLDQSATHVLYLLVIKQDVGHFMFPPVQPLVSTEPRKLINTPVITVTLGKYKDGDDIDKIKDGFDSGQKYLPRREIRDPTTFVINRRLHQGEVPSAVHQSAKCVYWDAGEGIWSDYGCNTTRQSKSQISCSCNHLSSFSVMMDVHDYIRDPTLEVVSMTCSIITVVSLAITISILFSVKSIQRSERTTLEKQLCISLLIGHLLVLTVLDKKYFNISDTGCSIVAGFLHYVFMTAFFWMFFEGHHLYRLVIIVFNTSAKYIVKYTIAAYGLPLVIVGIDLIVGVIKHENPYGRDEICWLATPNYIWSFIGPVIFLTVINLIVLVVAMRAAIVAKVSEKKSSIENIKIWLKGCFSLSALLGVTWLFGLAYIDYNQAFAYIFVILNGLQGFFIFLFRCVFNEQVRSSVVSVYRSRTTASDANKTPKATSSRYSSKDSGRGESFHDDENSSSDAWHSQDDNRKRKRKGKVVEEMESRKSTSSTSKSEKDSRVEPVDQFLLRLHQQRSKNKDMYMVCKNKKTQNKKKTEESSREDMEDLPPPYILYELSVGEHGRGSRHNNVNNGRSREEQRNGERHSSDHHRSYPRCSVINEEPDYENVQYI